MDSNVYGDVDSPGAGDINTAADLNAAGGGGDNMSREKKRVVHEAGVEYQRSYSVDHGSGGIEDVDAGRQVSPGNTRKHCWLMVENCSWRVVENLSTPWGGASAIEVDPVVPMAKEL